MHPSTPDFSIVVPLYNEEACAARSIRELLEALEARWAGQYELILVINGSVDGTVAICEGFAARHPQVRTVRFQTNQGYGGGILGGLAQARGAVCGFSCGDGQVPPDVLTMLMAEIADGGDDVIKAIRINRQDGLMRHVQSAVYNWLFGCLFQIPARDINAMPKLMRRETFRRLALESTDWFIDAEIMIKAHHAGLRVREVPTASLGRLGGASAVRLGTCVEFLRNAARLISSGRLRAWKRLAPQPEADGIPTYATNP
jgi:glycosyltransferase involved in cell wall biosynthesis